MFSDLKTLFIYHGLPQFYPAPPLSKSMIVCGPFVEDRIEDGIVKSLATPFGKFDLVEIIDKIPADQQPDIAFIRVDASGSVMPYRLRHARFPIILLIGDTHHMNHPIRKVADYVRNVHKDFIITYNNRHHAHYLIESGQKNVLWVPGITVTPHKVDFVEDKQNQVCFIGNVVKTHRRRGRLLKAMRATQMPLLITEARGIESATIYARNAVSFNCSLNGDLNMRCYEVIASGGLLLSDRLHAETGWDEIVEEGKHYVAFDSIDDLIDKCKALLNDPQMVRTISKAGVEHYYSEIGLEPVLERLYKVIFLGESDDLLTIRDRRIKPHLLDGMRDNDILLQRVELYEALQEFSSHLEQCKILLLPSVSRHTVSDISDIQKLSLTLVEDGEDVERSDADRIFEDCAREIAADLQVLNVADATTDRSYDLAIMSVEELMLFVGRDAFATFDSVLLWDFREAGPKIVDQIKVVFRPTEISPLIFRPIFSKRLAKKGSSPASYVFEPPDMFHCANHNLRVETVDQDTGAQRGAGSIFPFLSARIMERYEDTDYEHINIGLREAGLAEKQAKHLYLKLQNGSAGVSLELRKSELCPKVLTHWPLLSDKDEWGSFIRLVPEPSRFQAWREREFLAVLDNSERAFIAGLIFSLPKIIASIDKQSIEGDDLAMWKQAAEQLSEAISQRL